MESIKENSEDQGINLTFKNKDNILNHPNEIEEVRDHNEISNLKRGISIIDDNEQNCSNYKILNFKSNLNQNNNHAPELPESHLNRNEKNLFNQSPALSPINRNFGRRIGINIKQNQEVKEEKKEKKKSFIQMLQKDESINDIVPNDRTKSLFFILRRIFENKLIIMVMLIITILGITLNDIKYLLFPKSTDIIFIIFYSILIFISVIEFITNCVMFTDYSCSFYFWVDIVSLISLFTEIEFLEKKIVLGFIKEGEREIEENIFSKKVMTIQKIIRLIRHSRLIKVHKIFIIILKNHEVKQKMEKIKAKLYEKIKQKEKRALIHSNKKKDPHNILTVNNYSPSMLYSSTNLGLNRSTNKSTSQLKTISAKATGSIEPNANLLSKLNSHLFTETNFNQCKSINNNSAETALKKILVNSQKEAKKKFIIESESKIGRVLFINITKKIILIILIFSIFDVIFDDDNYIKGNENNYDFLADLIEIKYNITPQEENYLKTEIKKISDKNFQILMVIREEITIFDSKEIDSNLKHYRFGELKYTLSFNDMTKIIYSNKKEVKTKSGLNLLRSFLIFSIMFYLSYLINMDGSHLIYNPLEVMLEVVDKVAKDPVNFKSLEELNKNMVKSIDNLVKKSKKRIKMKDMNMNLDYEIKTIQFAIIRISSLIAIGFGEAGGEILKENINSEQGLNPMLPGKKIYSVFGFCFIRNFTEINEALQEKTILFVNSIANIVHSNVNKFNGVCNKNIGDCFLLVWKFKTNDQKEDNEKPNIDSSKPDTKLNQKIQIPNKTNNDYILNQKDDPNYQLVADSALLSFLSIIKKIYKSQTILSLSNEPLLKKKFGQKFKVRMGFGLHLGWGIEGAIGSFYKIDCSYLSPNVNTAARIETATNIYGVDILFSGDFYECLTPYAKKLCRQIDTVALKGCLFPVKLFTVDINQNLKAGKEKKDLEISNKERRRIINTKKNKIKSLYDKSRKNGKPKSIVEIYYKMSKGFCSLVKEVKSQEFLKYFKKGFDCYISGSWGEAYKYLKQSLYIQPNDPPTIKLCNFILKNNKKAPIDWKGFRKLDSKF